MTTVGDPDESSLRLLLPPIRRARGYRLYDQRGRRYLDLYLAGGRALLGHRPGRALLELKDLLSRGLAADFPSVFDRRLAKALKLVLPDYSAVRVFANEERLVAAFARIAPAGSRAAAQSIVDPLVAEGGEAAETAAGGFPFISRWRPLLPAGPEPGDGPAVAVPLLPFPGSFAPAVACVRGVPESELPPSDPVSPALLGALVRSVYDLVRFAQRFREQEDRDRTWAPFDAPWWSRIGPYLVARCEKSEYSKIFRRLLEKGVFISPRFPGPSIVPAEYSEGELKPLRALAHEWVLDR